MKPRTVGTDILGFALLVLFLEMTLFVCTLLPFCNVPFLLSFLGLFPSSVVFWIGFAKRTDSNPFYRARRGASASGGILPAGGPRDNPGVAKSDWLHRLVNSAGVLCFVGVVCSTYGLRNGAGEIQDGQYVAGNHKLGIPYRRISSDEYWELNRHAARAVACISTFGSIVPVASSIWERRNRKTSKRNSATEGQPSASRGG